MMILVMALCVVLVGASALARNFNPKQTKVSVLPVISLTGEKWAKLRNSQINVGYNELKCLFAERGFQVVDYRAVKKGCESIGVNLSDERKHNSETVCKVGRKVKARLAVFLVITDSTQRSKISFFVTENEAEVKVNLWVVDASGGVSLLKEKRFTAKRVSGWGHGLGSALQVDAVRRVAREALADFLKPYPVVNANVKRHDMDPTTP